MKKFNGLKSDMISSLLNSNLIIKRKLFKRRLSKMCNIKVFSLVIQVLGPYCHIHQ